MDDIGRVGYRPVSSTFRPPSSHSPPTPLPSIHQRRNLLSMIDVRQGVEYRPEDDAYDGYFHHLSSDIQYFETLGHIRQPRADIIHTIAKVIDILRVYGDNVSCLELKDIVTDQIPTIPSDVIITLTIRAWLQIGVTPTVLCGHKDGEFEWNVRASFAWNVADVFRETDDEVSLAQGPTILQETFTMANLERYYGIRIIWTNCLKKHLLYHPGPRQLFLYRHIQYLRLLLSAGEHGRGENSDVDINFGSPLPLELLNELLDTMNLLFPIKGKATRTILNRENMLNAIKSGVSTLPRKFHYSDYEYYSDRLAQLHIVYNGAPAHWWVPLVDRRNKKEHLTIWIAIWAFVFAFLSLVFGLLSAIYGVKQYQLGIASACADNGNHARLVKYCG